MSGGGCNTVLIKLVILKNLEEILNLDGLPGLTKNGKIHWENAGFIRPKRKKA